MFLLFVKEKKEKEKEVNHAISNSSETLNLSKKLF